MTEALGFSGRQFRVVVEPTSDLLLSESDVADAQPVNNGRAELALRLNEAGVSRLKVRGSTLIGKLVSVYWNGRLISRPKIDNELVRDITVTVPSERDANLMAIVLRAGALPNGASLAVAK